MASSADRPGCDVRLAAATLEYKLDPATDLCLVLVRALKARAGRATAVAAAQSPSLPREPNCGAASKASLIVITSMNSSVPIVWASPQRKEGSATSLRVQFEKLQHSARQSAKCSAAPCSAALFAQRGQQNEAQCPCSV